MLRLWWCWWWWWFFWVSGNLVLLAPLWKNPTNFAVLQWNWLLGKYSILIGPPLSIGIIAIETGVDLDNSCWYRDRISWLKSRNLWTNQNWLFDVESKIFKIFLNILYFSENTGKYVNTCSTAACNWKVFVKIWHIDLHNGLIVLVVLIAGFCCCYWPLSVSIPTLPSCRSWLPAHNNIHRLPPPHHPPFTNRSRHSRGNWRALTMAIGQ